jgi:hypothetical protein
MDNPEELATLLVQDTGRRQTQHKSRHRKLKKPSEKTEGATKKGLSRENSNIGLHKTQDEDKQSKTKQNTHNTENLKDEQHGPHEKPGVTPGAREGKQFHVMLS